MLAALVLTMAALGPAAAFAPPAHGQQAISAGQPDCECCDEGALGAAMACAACCHAAAPSMMDALPRVPHADPGRLVLKTAGDGLALQPPAPPPRH